MRRMLLVLTALAVTAMMTAVTATTAMAQDQNKGAIHQSVSDGNPVPATVGHGLKVGWARNGGGGFHRNH